MDTLNRTFSGNEINDLRDVVSYPVEPDKVRTPNARPITAVRFVDEMGNPVRHSDLYQPLDGTLDGLSELPPGPGLVEQVTDDQFAIRPIGVAQPVSILTRADGDARYAAQGSTGGGSTAWLDITGKPATFPPTLPIAESDVTSLVADLAGKAAVSHSHTTADLPAYPVTLPPTGTAGGDLIGTYPAPTIRFNVSLGGLPTAPTAPPGTSTAQLATTAFVGAAVAAGGGGGGGGAPSGPAGGDLSGSYPNPTLAASVALAGDPTRTTAPALHDNDSSIPTTAWVQTELATAIAAIPPPPAVTVPAGTVAFGGTGGAVTGNSSLAWDDTNKSLVITGNSGAAPGFWAIAAVPASPPADIFRMEVTNGSNNTGNIFRLRSGPTTFSQVDAFKVDMSGDAAMSGSIAALNSSPLIAGGAGYFGMFLGNFTGGNLGLFGGTGAPTFSTFGKYGSIYMDGAAPGLPYINVNAGTGWDRLVSESSTQTLSNKTITGYVALAVGPTAPGAPVANQFWFNTDDGTTSAGAKLYIWYNDGNTTQWVPVA